MDITTVVGLVLFAALITITILISEGVHGFLVFLNAEAFLLVIGGTFCALMVHYPLTKIVNSFKVFLKVLVARTEDAVQVVMSLVQLSAKARQKGLLSLQDDVKRIDNDFLQRGVQMVVDGHDQEFIRNMLETEIGFIRERHNVGEGIFNALGTYAPAFGIIGTVFGMILMLNDIQDVTQVPRRMAVALGAAFFGLGSGYLIFLPMAGKLRQRSEEELLVKEIIIRGVMLLQSGASPTVVEGNLKAYLEPSKRAAIHRLEAPKAAGAPAPSAGTPPAGTPPAGTPPAGP